jgi:cardiolipin synthase
MGGLLYIGYALMVIVALAAIIHVLMDNRQPAKTMAWVLVIGFIPVIGVVFYLFFGINHRKERIISQGQMDELTKRSMLSFVGQHNFRVPERQKPLVDLFVNQNLALPFKDNRIDIMTDGYAFFPELLKDIAEATHHIHINIYIFEDDALGRLVADALMTKARQGVKVRLIYDDVGCWRVGNRFFEQMREAGVEVVPFLPVHFPSFTSKVNYRNHRKIIVIDGRIGYIGGMNIARRYVSDKWRDTMLRVQGGVVYALQRAFLVDWYFVDHTLITDRIYYPPVSEELTAKNHQLVAQVVTSGPMARYPEIMQGFVRIILAARRYIYIETPYFLPNEPILFALKTAALAGVDVRLMCPLYSDARFLDWASRSYLREIHEAGAKVYLYEPGFLHSKLLISDDSLVSCGSTNVDFRSLENNFEANVFVYDEGTALRLKKIFLDDQSQAVLLSDVPNRLHPKFYARLWESFTRLVSPLL